MIRATRFSASAGWMDSQHEQKAMMMARSMPIWYFTALQSGEPITLSHDRNKQHREYVTKITNLLFSDRQRLAVRPLRRSLRMFTASRHKLRSGSIRIVSECPPQVRFLGDFGRAEQKYPKVNLADPAGLAYDLPDNQ